MTLFRARCLSSCASGKSPTATLILVGYHAGHPDLIHEVLVTKKNSFVKQPRQMRVMRQLFGHGLLTSDGKLWLK